MYHYCGGYLYERTNNRPWASRNAGYGGRSDIRLFTLQHSLVILLSVPPSAFILCESCEAVNLVLIPAQRWRLQVSVTLEM